MISHRTDTRAPHDGAASARRPWMLVLVQFLKFGVVGVSNTLLTLIVYTLLLKVFGVWYLAASAIGFLVGAVNGFLLNRRWTFAGHVGDALTPVRWGVVQSCGLAINEGLLYVFVHDASLDKLLAQLCATAFVTVSTFFANRAWTFRGHATAPAEAPVA
ncbi:MAG TPA: GtrA family protein [Solirubrobacteraceae bacterium]|nr:GtrA family protein [Solirubrobacteraceae bacterium]